MSKTALKSPTITIVGVGALGSHLVQLLRNEGKLKLIDFDRVESKNTLSQFHGKTNVGKLKVTALQSTMQLLWGLQPKTVSNKLEANNVDQLLGDADLIIDCLDNGAGRRLIQAFARKQVVPCLHGALAADGQFGRVCWDDRFVIDDEDGVGVPTCEGGEHLPFVAIVASYLARAAQIYLHDRKRVGFQISPAGSISV